MREAMANLGGAMTDLDDAGARLDAALREADSEQDPEAATADDRPATELDPEFEAIVGQPVPEARIRYRQLLRELGPTGATEISSRLRMQGYTTTRQTVHGWLSDDITSGLASNDDGKYTWIGPT